MGGTDASGHDDTTDRFADDPAFAVHEGGKLSVTRDPPDRARSPTSP